MRLKHYFEEWMDWDSGFEAEKDASERETLETFGTESETVFYKTTLSCLGMIYAICIER